MRRTDELIKLVLELDAAATPGPWVVRTITAYYEVRSYVAHAEWTLGDWMDAADASLIAEYRTLAPVLARMLQRALEELGSVAASSSWRIRQDASDAIEEIEAMAEIALEEIEEIANA